MRTRPARGFTFVELAVVLLCVALLASLSAPLVTTWITRAKESALKENLFVLRGALDAYYADKGQYPVSLADLVSERYIRFVPVEPISGRDDGWVEEYSAGSDIDGVVDVHSGSNDQALDDSCYCDW
ncbi:type II secretion system protein [Microbulbifer sp. CNSA002]|uniref:type II secretion system protein n=1 Tax=Microbulbifer sp. CNSA002 TaxID=3373604 RepID=UPI0039B397BA